MGEVAPFGANHEYVTRSRVNSLLAASPPHVSISYSSIFHPHAKQRGVGGRRSLHRKLVVALDADIAQGTHE